MTSTARRTLIVIPALNEESQVGSVVAEVIAALPGVSILVVDDGSTDSTAAVAEAAGARVVRLPFNLGVGGAMRTGFRFAQINGFDAVVQIDADGQHNPRSVPALLAELDSADIVIGARFAGEGDYQLRGPRRWAMRFLATILSHVTGTRLTDTTSGLKANGPRAIAVFAHNYPAEYFGDTVEALVIAARSGFRVVQVPAALRPRAGGTPSNNTMKSAMHLARAFLALSFALSRPKPKTQEGTA